jgi:AcrR family transcriptional regulator
MSSARDRWLDQALDALTARGPGALRIDALAAELGLSKGSFFHHFAGAAAFKTAVLERYESRATAVLASGRDRLESVAPQQLLAELTAAVDTSESPLPQPRLEVAVRAWAYQDEEVRATQERIDTARLQLLESVWLRLVPNPEQARVSALLPYLIAIGSSMALTPITPAELRQVYELLLPLVPGADS